MGHRTLSLGLVLRALFLDSDAYAELRDDDNPFVEGLFLLVIIGILTALLNLIGQLLAWASTPRPRPRSRMSSGNLPADGVVVACRRATPELIAGSSGSSTTWAGRSSRRSSERPTRPALRSTSSLAAACGAELADLRRAGASLFPHARRQGRAEPDAGHGFPLVHAVVAARLDSSRSSRSAL